MPRPLEIRLRRPGPDARREGRARVDPVGVGRQRRHGRADAREAGLESPLVLVYLPKRGADTLKKALATAKAAEDTSTQRGTRRRPRAATPGRRWRPGSRRRERDIGSRSTTSSAGRRCSSRAAPRSAATPSAEAVEAAAHERPAAALSRVRRGRRPPLEQGVRAGEAGLYRGPRGRRLQGEAGGRTPCAPPSLDSSGRGRRGPRCAPTSRPPRTGGRPTPSTARSRCSRSTASSAPRATASPWRAKDLDPRGINHVRFQVEDVVLAFPERLAIAGLIQNADSTIGAKPNEVHLHVGEFLRAMRELARRAGGEAPLPAAYRHRPSSTRSPRSRGTPSSGGSTRPATTSTG